MKEDKKEIKVAVVLTEGYQQRYTKACLDVIRKRESKEGFGQHAACRTKTG
ncbi:MAG: hypothetical protein NC331_11480 [Lachnospiraceae bacterium]|nr:hypothetical protein [Lachnospiraceae bacterium]MCM1239989.1 hypothetical protein [Lachnospiraceae bacterium]